MQTAHFDGRLGPLYAIFLQNLLFTVLTLGLYRFWAATRVRRYLTGHLSLRGDRMEYTGTGWELFKGFLIVTALIFLPLVVLIAGLTLAYGPEVASIAQFLLIPAFILLIPYARFTGLRYRLTRTQWRGVRFGMSGSPWGYVGKTIVTYAAFFGSSGLAGPQTTLARERYRLDRIQFGDLQGHLRARWDEAPWISYLLAPPVAVVLIALVIGIGYAVLAVTGLIAPLTQFGLEMEERLTAGAFSLTLLIALILGVTAFNLVLIAAFVIPFAWHHGRFLRFIGQRWGLGGEGGPHFAPPQHPMDYVKLLAGNALIMALTLGLGAPIVWMRSMRFITRVGIVNADALDDAAQSAETRPKSGEGLLDALDVGVV